jgi:acyl-coenzyme A thioesterase PaaI-like protein
MSTADPMTPSELQTRVDAMLAIPLQAALHASPIDPDHPCGGLEFPVTGLAINPGGTLHAGALSTILEAAGFLALLPALGAGEHAVTHHISTQILSAGHLDELVRVTVELERRTRRMGFVSATARVGERVLARSQITKSVIEIR